MPSRVQISCRLCPSSSTPFHTTSGSRHPSAFRFSSSWSRSSWESGGLSDFKFSSILICISFAQKKGLAVHSGFARNAANKLAVGVHCEACLLIRFWHHKLSPVGAYLSTPLRQHLRQGPQQGVKHLWVVLLQKLHVSHPGKPLLCSAVPSPVIALPGLAVGVYQLDPVQPNPYTDLL